MSRRKSKRGPKNIAPGVRVHAVNRMKAGTGVSELARELGVHRSTLYQWMQDFKAAERQNRPMAEEVDPTQYKVRQLQQRVAELEGVIGRQKLELDFFQGALRRTGGSRPNPSGSGGRTSTPKSVSGRRYRKAN